LRFFIFIPFAGKFSLKFSRQKAGRQKAGRQKTGCRMAGSWVCDLAANQKIIVFFKKNYKKRNIT
jgi:hypothetical protein